MHEKELHVCEFTTNIQIITGVIILQFFGIFLKTQIKIHKLFLIFIFINFFFIIRILNNQMEAKRKGKNNNNNDNPTVSRTDQAN